MDEWLTRTSHNQITGPFTQAEVCQKIQRGELKLQDEVCAANGYWFYLHEAEEVRSQLGVQVPRMKGFGHDDEITQTQTQTEIMDEDRTDPELRRPSLSVVPPALILQPPSFLDPSLEFGFEGEETTVVQQFRAAKSTADSSGAAFGAAVKPSLSIPIQPKIEVRGEAGMDRSLLVWIVVISIFVIGVAAVLTQVFGLITL